eukprot:scaffold1.g5461.t1
MDAVFAHSEQRVLAAFLVSSVASGALCEISRPQRAEESARAMAQAVKCEPASSGKNRVLCLTAKRRSRKRGFKGTLHICKASGSRIQVRKSFRLKHLARIEAFVDSPGQQEYLELTFVQRGFTGGEVRLAFEVRSAAARLEILGTLYGFCRSHEARPPAVVGVDRRARAGGGRAAAWQTGSGAAWARGSELDVAAAVFGEQAGASVGGGKEPGPKGAGAPKLEEGEGGADGAGAGAGPAAAAAQREANPLWGQREEQQVQSMLEMISTGASSVEELRERLGAELAALEDAQVHEILETERGPLVGGVLSALDASVCMLDDLEDNLALFDAKLRHMREHITTIEARNNALELHSRNNGRLLGALADLVGRLSLPPAAEDLLRAREIAAANMVDAAWDLQRHLEALVPGAGAGGTASGGAAAEGGGAGGPLPEELAQMAAVGQQRQRLHGLMRLFLDKASGYLSRELSHLAEPVLARVNAAQVGRGAARLRPPDHGAIRRRAAELAPLLEVVSVMRPAAMPPLREAYCKALNALLRRELHVAVAEAARMGAAAEAGGALGDLDLLNPPRGGAEGAMQSLERMSTAASLRASSGGGAGGLPVPRGGGLGGADLAAAYREGGVVPLHEGFAAVLDSHLPLLAGEAGHCVALLFPASPAAAPGGGTPRGRTGRSAAAEQEARPPQDASGSGGEGGTAAGGSAREVRAAAAALLEGVDAELVYGLENVKLSRALLCLPILGAVLAWRARLAGRTASEPLEDALAKCEQWLRAAVEAHVSERAAAVGRVVGGSGIKSQHVLPFVANFPSVAARMEALLQPWQAAAAGTAPQACHEATSAPARARGAAPAAPALPRPSPFETGGGRRRRLTSSTTDGEHTPEPGSAGLSSEEDVSFMTTEEEEQQQQAGAGAAPAPSPPAAAGAAAPGAAVRACADSAYERLGKAVLGAVDALGASDGKHGQRLRLENHAFLLLGLRALPAEPAPVLAACMEQAQGLKDGAMADYVEQQVGGKPRIEYAKLSRVVEFSQKLDRLLQSVRREEVHFQQHFTPGEVRQLLSAAGSGLDKRVGATRARVRKHLGASSPYLVDEVWERLEGALLARWSRLEEQLRLCYPGVALQPSQARRPAQARSHAPPRRVELRRLLAAAARSDGG